MTKYILTLLIVTCFAAVNAQQTTHYTQYLFNQFGNNPAYANNNNCYEMVVGRREQWIGFPSAPLMQFVGLYKTFGHTGYKNYWHGAGLYMEQDKQNILSATKIQLNYSYHFRVSREFTLSSGVFAGAHYQTMSTNGIDTDDPAILPNQRIFTYPDVTFGMRLHSKKDFYGITLRHVGASTLRQDWQMIGTETSLLPHLYFTAGKAIRSKAFYYTYIPSMQMKWSFTQLPTLDFSFMFLVMNKFGIGANYRMHESLSAMLFLKVMNGVKISFAYDFIVNDMRHGAATSREIMMKASNCGGGSQFGEGKKYCPAYSL